MVSYHHQRGVKKQVLQRVTNVLLLIATITVILLGIKWKVILL